MPAQIPKTATRKDAMSQMIDHTQQPAGGGAAGGGGSEPREAAAGIQPDDPHSKRVDRVFTVDDIETFAADELQFMVLHVPFTERPLLEPPLQRVPPPAQPTRARIP
jgi:hypothetical protein